MRAVLVPAFGPFETMTVASLPDPEPGAGEVVVDVVAAEANYPDILVIEGRYQVKPPLPFSPGKAAAGRVARLGPGVSGLSVGQPVAVQAEYGAYAEKLLAKADACFPMPEGMDFDTAAALGLVYQTAWFALRERAAMRPGARVLVLGASGGIGVASVQLAKAFGAASVIAGVLGADNAQIARRAGADHVVELGRDGLQQGLKQEIAALTDGHGVDIVVDPVGGAATAAALRTLAWCGRLVVIGFASGEIPQIAANYLLVKNISVLGLQWSDYRERAPGRVAEAQGEIFDLARRGLLAPLISRRLPLERFAEALTALRDGRAQGKIILTVREDGADA